MKYLFSTLIIICFYSCYSDSKIKSSQQVSQKYLNHNDSVKYVGKEACLSCHSDHYHSFIETGMGKSFNIANKNKSVIDDHNNPVIYDTIKDLYYKPFWKTDSLYILEFRLNNIDTVHKLIQKIDYVIGSGQHTNSHLYNENGYIHQIPYTFYTQENTANLPPGYEQGNNTRFSRKIGLECMSCHNAHPDFIETSQNKYNIIPNGIDCERCHGPGELHVNEKSKGIIIDTANYIDYSIVNPSRLSEELTFDICSRCHLQGISVLKNNKNWEDFRPGTKLSETMEIFLPRHENNKDFIMASHVERLKQSKCHTIGKVTCIDCHNPHKSVTKTSKNFFNNKCLKCHSSCDEKIDNTDCVSCHMKTSSSIDIPHVTITDHNISVNQEISSNDKGKFLGLKCINNTKPTNLSKAKAYLKYYESFQANNNYLDSAKLYLNLCDIENSFVSYIKYFYLKQDYISLIQFYNYNKDKLIIDNFTKNNIGMTYYRIGESYVENSLNDSAYIYLNKAIENSPYDLDFQFKTAVLELKMSMFETSKDRLKNIIKLNSRYSQAYFNLGSIYMNVDKNYKKARENFEKAVLYDPDYNLALINLNYLKNK